MSPRSEIVAIAILAPIIIASDRWTMYQTPTVYQVRLLDSLAASSSVRVTFGKRHSVSSSADTIPQKDREAFSKLAAAVLCAIMTPPGGSSSEILNCAAPLTEYVAMLSIFIRPNPNKRPCG